MLKEIFWELREMQETGISCDLVLNGVEHDNVLLYTDIQYIIGDCEGNANSQSYRMMLNLHPFRTGMTSMSALKATELYAKVFAIYLWQKSPPTRANMDKRQSHLSDCLNPNVSGLTNSNY